MKVEKKVTVDLAIDEITTVRQFIDLLQEIEQEFYNNGLANSEGYVMDLKNDIKNFFEHYGVKL